ncbi:MAG: putative Ig domain-containing protein, partial [Anaerolineae bacterium]|nr:putative Ig domain-containing protein [Anaerolineae bacterium]
NITDQVTIDGTTQDPASPCNAPPIIIVSDGIFGVDGLSVVGPAASGTVIRGVTITGFGGNGLVLSGADANQVQCSDIGGSTGNGLDGILIANSSLNQIGGAGNENIISVNGSNGINITTGTGNRISQNSIFSNAGLGINLGAGANGDQANPIITVAQSDGVSSTTVTGTFASTPGGSFRIEFFQCDSTPDEGQTLIGTIPSLGTDISGNASISQTFGVGLNVGDAVSATATNLANGNTSAFSTCQFVIGQPVYQSNPPDGDIIDLITSVGNALSASINVTNSGNDTLDITGISLSNTTDFTPLTTTFPLSVNAGDTTIGVNIEVQCNATTTTGSPFTTILTVDHNAGPDATYTINCTVDPAPVPDFDSVPLAGDPIPFGSVPVGTFNTFTLSIISAGSAALDVNSPVFAGADAGDFSIVSGLDINGLPGGSDTPVIIQCTPSNVGPLTADLTLTTNDPDAAEATVNYPMSCTGVAPVITLSPTTLPSTYEGDLAYLQTITASDGTAPYTFAITSGALPLNMSLDPATGEISGIPDPGTAGTYNFSIVATDSHALAFTSAPQPYTLVVNPGITVGPATLPDGTVGVAYPSTFHT